MEIEESSPPDSPGNISVGFTLRDVPWRWSDPAIGLVPLIVLFLSMPWIGPVLIKIGPTWLWIPLALLVVGWMLGFPLAMAQVRGLGRWRGPRLQEVLVEGSISAPALLAVWVCLGLVDVALSFATGKPVQPGRSFEGHFLAPSRIHVVALVILATTVGPIAEEFFFRGLLYNVLRRKLPVLAAASIQGGVFGFCHPFDLTSRAFISVVGLALALVYEWRKTLLAPIFVHILQNAIALSIMAWSVSAYVEGPVLGVRADPKTGACRVVDVPTGTAAEAAGIKVGDIVVSVDGQPVARFADLTAIIASKKVGDRVHVGLEREGRPMTVEAILKHRGR